MTTAASTAAAAERRIRDYEQFGIHRTGGDADNQTAHWLVEELSAAGIDARSAAFDFPKLGWERAELIIDGVGVPGVPMFDGGLTGPEGASGTLGGGIARIELQQDDPIRFGNDIYERLEQLSAAGAAGVVMIMGDDQGGPILRNAERPTDPVALPVLQVAPQDAGPLRDRDGAAATLIIDGARQPATALNVVATIPGSDPDAAPVGLMTPKSGWYTCAAERGGGIAVWLAAAERIAAGPQPKRSLELVASSGHELHHLGLDAYFDGLESDGRAVADFHAWLHLGASIGARRGSARFAASDDDLWSLAQSRLAAPGIERAGFPSGQSGYGEARNVSERGGRFVSLLGGHAYFHSPRDLFDVSVDLDLLCRHIEAVESMLRDLLDG